MTSYKINEEGQKAEGASVVCVWCGGVIRAGAEKAARRMCQQCFARMMREHCREHQPRGNTRHASER